jgi:hypothetical protein
MICCISCIKIRQHCANLDNCAFIINAGVVGVLYTKQCVIKLIERLQICQKIKIQALQNLQPWSNWWQTPAFAN